MARDRTTASFRSAGAPRLVDRWPVLGAQLLNALADEGEGSLARQVETLRVVALCGCGDDCQSFHCISPPDGPYGPGHRNVVLEPPWPGMLVLDVVDGFIVYVEVLDRGPLN